MIVHITGARPNFPKAAPVIEALAARGVRQRLVHTGQHYDDRLSAVFFAELGLPTPDVNLGVGSGSHAVQTAAVLVGLEELFVRERPELVVVYGDVNSTLAAALAAAKLGVPVAHVEAGLRSFDDSMPEEINRRLTDQLCELLFVTSQDGVEHLAREGVPPSRVHLVGNPMIDTLIKHLDALDATSLRSAVPLPDRFAVVTLHRPANVDDPASAARLVMVLQELAERVPLVVPLHPRGRAALEGFGLASSERITIVEPLPYTVFLGLVRDAVAVITDSGGVQEETTVLGVPCLTLRPNTERPVTISHGTNRLVTVGDVVAVLEKVLASGSGGNGAGEIGPSGEWAPGVRPAPLTARPPLWDGSAGVRIADLIVDWLAR